MTRRFALSFLTVHEVSAPQAARIAAETGYDAVGFRLLAPTPDNGALAILTDPALGRELDAVLRDTAIPVADIEIVRLGAATDLSVFRPFLEFGQRIGAKNVLVAGDDPDRARLTDSFARFCQMAQPYGLTADLEFMPWTAVKTAAEAQAIVQAAGQPNGGVLVDALHVSRSGTTLDQIRALRPDQVHYAQLCDGFVPFDPSTEGLIRIAREERQRPGDGQIDLAGILRALPPDVLLAIEVPRLAEAAHVPAPERAARALAAARRVVAAL